MRTQPLQLETPSSPHSLDFRCERIAGHLNHYAWDVPGAGRYEAINHGQGWRTTAPNGECLGIVPTLPAARRLVEDAGGFTALCGACAEKAAKDMGQDLRDGLHSHSG